MASKKTVTGGPSRKRRNTSFDPPFEPTFLNEKAANIFRESIVKRTCIPERGIKLSAGELDHVIHRRKWQKLVIHPEAAFVSVVREFYANLKAQFSLDSKVRKVLVRGKQVMYDRSTINALFGLPDIEGDEYTSWLEQGPNITEVIDRIAQPGTEWKEKEGKLGRFPRAKLVAESRAWHYFISAKLLPNHHVSDVTPDRAFLNFAIQTGLSIDVGYLIESSIISFIRTEKGGGLGHPSLICMLCLKAGVPTNAAEEIQHPHPPITSSMIAAFSKAKAASSPTQAAGGSSAAGPSSSQHRTHPAFATVSQRPKSSSTPPADISELSDQMDDMRHSLASITRRMDCMMKEQRQQYQFLLDYTTALHRSSASSSDPSAVVLPTQPPLLQYPPPSDSEDSTDETAS